MKIEELKVEIAEKQRALARLEGKFGACSKCGKDDHLSKGLCMACYRNVEKEHGRSVWVWLIGKTITDIETESTLYYPDLRALILDDGSRVHPDAYSDPVSLEVEKN